VLAPGGLLALALNSPYAAVVRKGLPDYFASGSVHPSGLAGAGVPVPFYHRTPRTLADYLDAFLAAGLRLARLLDVDHPDAAGGRAAGHPLGPRGSRPTARRGPRPGRTRARRGS